MSQEHFTEEPEPDAARRASLLHFIRGRLPGLPRPRALEPPAKEIESKELSSLENHFAVIVVPTEETDGQVLREGLGLPVSMLARNGFLRDNTAIEARPIIPEDEITPSVLRATSDAADAFKDVAAAEADVSVYRTNAPITPTEHVDSPIDHAQVLAEIGAEHADFDRQIHGLVPSHDVDVMTVGLTGVDYARKLFGDRLVFGTDPLEEHQPLILTRLGAQSRELVLAPPFPRPLAIRQG